MKLLGACALKKTGLFLSLCLMEFLAFKMMFDISEIRTI